MIRKFTFHTRDGNYEFLGESWSAAGFELNKRELKQGIEKPIKSPDGVSILAYKVKPCSVSDAAELLQFYKDETGDFDLSNMAAAIGWLLEECAINQKDVLEIVEQWRVT